MPENAQVLPLLQPTDPQLLRAEVLAVQEGGMIRVRLDDGREWEAAWLQAGATMALELACHDQVIVLPPVGQHPAVVIGRVGPYTRPATPARVCIEATESLTLKCGESSLELAADGKAALKGEDVLVRARGLQRIKAGSVSIN